ncbi:hypothetical protein F5141DRAFT_1067971 [Pisolithus sp. B1]|nr:hypothetical protein F5141DRAFT_1067971 [Pisolithus sp. B1]
MEDITVVFLPLLSVGYDHDIMQLAMLPNFPMKEDDITCMPDLVLSMTSMDKCTFTQSHHQVFGKIVLEVTAHPEVEMVVIVVIEEVPAYHAPCLGSTFTCWLINPPTLDLEVFILACNPCTRPDKLQLALIVTGDHTWCKISHVHYYMWLENDMATTLEEMSIQINLDVEAKQTEYTTHGIFPDNTHMDLIEQL